MNQQFSFALDYSDYGERSNQTMDFTLTTYRQLLTTLRDKGYAFQPFRHIPDGLPMVFLDFFRFFFISNERYYTFAMNKFIHWW
ncbi:MAG: hypothetical protein V5A59_15100 [Bacteroidales bacterium]|nr:hypothetical protein [Bacteroidales bacterium]